MAIITLADAKAHMRIVFDDENELIVAKMEAAEAMIESMLGYSLRVRFPDTDEQVYPATVPGDLKEAVRQLTAHYFEQREAAVIGVSAGFVPLGVADIVRNRRVWSVPQ